MTIAPSIFGQLINAMARTAASDEAEPLTGDRVGEYLQQLLRTGSGSPEDPDCLEDVHLAMDQYLLIPFLVG
jgi:hypothetical protein